MTSKRLITASIATGMLAAALGFGVASKASAENPVTMNEHFPAHAFGIATKSWRYISFFAEVTLDEVGVDVVGISPFTEGGVQAFAICLGEEAVLIDEEIDSPLSPLDDALVECPLFSRGEEYFGGVAIFPLD